MTDSIVIMNDLQHFAEVLEAASGRDAEDVTTKVIHTMADEVADLAYQYAPKDTWELARSIGVDRSNREARVYASAPHAAFVEFGTWSHNVINPRMGTYEIRPRNASVLRFTGKDGRPVFTQLVRHPGIPAQLFMTRASEDVVDRFTEGIANVASWLVVNP